MPCPVAPFDIPTLLRKPSDTGAGTATDKTSGTIAHVQSNANHKVDRMHIAVPFQQTGWRMCMCHDQLLLDAKH
jgi:hypothetical protein